MIPESNITAMIAGLIFTAIIPIVVVILLFVKKKLSLIPGLIGFASFFISQIILRIPIIGVLSLWKPYSDFSQSFPILFAILIGGFSAGLFEESARLGSVAILKNRREWADSVSFGLGHGICEAVMLVGLSYISSISLAVMINAGTSLDSLGIDEATAEVIVTQLTDATPLMIGIAFFERICAVLFHIFCSVLIFHGARCKKVIRAYLAAIVLHTVFNSTVVLLAKFLNIYVAELFCGLFAIAAVIGIIKLKRASVAADEILPPPA